MRIQEMVKILGIADQTFDTALPQPWLDDMVKRLAVDYHRTLYSFVWLYDEEGGIGGRPFALTSEGNRLLQRMNEEHGCSYLLTPHALPVNHLGMIMEKLTLEEFLEKFDAEVHATLRERFGREGVSALVMFENITLDSSRLGERTALIVGPSCTYKTPEHAGEGCLGATPSVFQEATAYTRKEGN